MTDCPKDIMTLAETAITDGLQHPGVRIVCGPTGSGKVTRLSDAIVQMNAETLDRAIIEYSTPIEYVYSAKPEGVGN